MQDRRKTLIETAVRPLADNAEMKLAAAELLDSVMKEPASAGGEPVARWEAIDRKGRRRGSLLVWASAFLIFAAVIAWELPEIRRFSAIAGWTTQFGMPIPQRSEGTKKQLAAKLGEKNRLLLFGDMSKSGQAERREALWRSEPENPVYFAEYAGAYISEKEKLPPDFLEIARRIDPDNAWFTYQAAAVESDEALKANPRQGGRRVGRKMVYDNPKTWQILDEERFGRTLGLLNEARSQPKFTSYGADLLSEIKPLIPQETFAERIDSTGLLNVSSISSSLRLRRVSDVIAAKAMMLADTGEVAGYAPLASDADHLLRGMCGDSNVTLVDCLIADVAALTISENLGHAADKLGLPEDANRWKKIQERVKEKGEGRMSRKFLVEGKVTSPERSTGILLGQSIEGLARYAINQPLITDDELRPGRLFDHEVFSRLSAHALWVLLLPCVVVMTCYRFCVTATSRRLSLRMQDLLHGSDHAWIIGLGVLLPIVFMVAVNRLTPLGGRDLGVRGTTVLMPFAHFLGLWILWLVIPARIIRWRLAKRAGVFGFRRSSWWDWLAVAAAVAFVPMIGWAAISGVPGDFWWDFGLREEEAPARAMPFWTALVCAGIPLLWLASILLGTLLSRPESQFRRATVALLVVRTFAAMMIALTLSIPLFKAAEQHWFERDRLMKFDPHGPGWSVFEYKVAVQSRKELREILGYAP